jgi:hypothetical protein
VHEHLEVVSLEKAPVPVRAHLERIPESLIEVLSLDAEAESLAGVLLGGIPSFSVGSAVQPVQIQAMIDERIAGARLPYAATLE